MSKIDHARDERATIGLMLPPQPHLSTTGGGTEVIGTHCG
jgi:hypothetical protein